MSVRGMNKVSLFRGATESVTRRPSKEHAADFDVGTDKKAAKIALTKLVTDDRFPAALSGAIVMAAYAQARGEDADPCPVSLLGDWCRRASARFGDTFDAFFEKSFRTRVDSKLFSSSPPAQLMAYGLYSSHVGGGDDDEKDWMSTKELEDISLVVVHPSSEKTGRVSARVGTGPTFLIWEAVSRLLGKRTTSPFLLNIQQINNMLRDFGIKAETESSVNIRNRLSTAIAKKYMENAHEGDEFPEWMRSDENPGVLVEDHDKALQAFVKLSGTGTAATVSRAIAWVQDGGDDCGDGGGARGGGLGGGGAGGGGGGGSGLHHSPPAKVSPPNRKKSRPAVWMRLIFIYFLLCLTRARGEGLTCCGKCEIIEVPQLLNNNNSFDSRE